MSSSGSSKVQGTPWKGWAEDMVDASKLCEILGYSTSDPKVVGDDAADKIIRMEAAVERARISGRIRRFSVLNTATGEVLAYGYKRADVRRILGIP